MTTRRIEGQALIQNNNQGLLRNLDAVQITSIVVSAIALAALATGAVALSGIGAGFLAALGSYVPLYVTASGASLLGAGTLTAVLKEYAKKRNIEAPAQEAEVEAAPAPAVEAAPAPAVEAAAAGYVSDSDDEEVEWHDALEEPQPEAEELTAEQETQVLHAAATVIQRVFRGHSVRRNAPNA